MQKIPFADGSKTSSAKVTIDNVDYPVTPARYTGATPLSATVLNTMQTNIENAIDQNADNIGGEDYDSTATYEEGDIVKHEGQLYVANQDIDEPEEWTEAHWTATNVLSSAGGNEVVIGSETDVTSKTKLLIDEDDETDVFSEVVDSLSGNELDKAPSVHAVKQAYNEIVLWENSNPTSNFAGQTINLNTDNYSYYEIIWRLTTNSYQYKNTGKTPKSTYAYLDYVGGAGTLLGFKRDITAVTDTSITFADAYRINTNEVENGRCVPIKIIGYK